MSKEEIIGNLQKYASTAGSTASPGSTQRTSASYISQYLMNKDYLLDSIASLKQEMKRKENTTLLEIVTALDILSASEDFTLEPAYAAKALKIIGKFTITTDANGFTLPENMNPHLQYKILRYTANQAIITQEKYFEKLQSLWEKIDKEDNALEKLRTRIIFQLFTQAIRELNKDISNKAAQACLNSLQNHLKTKPLSYKKFLGQNKKARVLLRSLHRLKKDNPWMPQFRTHVGYYASAGRQFAKDTLSPLFQGIGFVLDLVTILPFIYKQRALAQLSREKSSARSLLDANVEAKAKRELAEFEDNRETIDPIKKEGLLKAIHPWCKKQSYFQSEKLANTLLEDTSQSDKLLLALKHYFNSHEIKNLEKEFDMRRDTILFNQGIAKLSGLFAKHILSNILGLLPGALFGMASYPIRAAWNISRKGKDKMVESVSGKTSDTPTIDLSEITPNTYKAIHHDLYQNTKGRGYIQLADQLIKSEKENKPGRWMDDAKSAESDANASPSTATL